MVKQEPQTHRWKLQSRSSRRSQKAERKAAAVSAEVEDGMHCLQVNQSRERMLQIHQSCRSPRLQTRHLPRRPHRREEEVEQEEEAWAAQEDGNRNHRRHQMHWSFRSQRWKLQSRL